MVWKEILLSDKTNFPVIRYALQENLCLAKNLTKDGSKRVVKARSMVANTGFKAALRKNSHSTQFSL